jgi:hypothetical protein
VYGLGLFGGSRLMGAAAIKRSFWRDEREAGPAAAANRLSGYSSW